MRVTQDLNSFGEIIAHAQCSVDENINCRSWPREEKINNHGCWGKHAHSWQWLLRNLSVSCRVNQFFFFLQLFLCGTHGIYIFIFSSTEHCAWAIISPKEFKSCVTRISFALKKKKNWSTRHETDRFLNNHCQECACLPQHPWLFIFSSRGHDRQSSNQNFSSRGYDRQSSEQNNRKLISLHNNVCSCTSHSRLATSPSLYLYIHLILSM
jgi:hypothetical protein